MMWLIGTKITKGMKYELEIAKKMRIPIRCYGKISHEWKASERLHFLEEVGVVLRLDARQLASVILHQQGLEIAKKMRIPIRCYDERLDRITPDTLSIDDRVNAEFLAELKGATLVWNCG